MASAHGSFNPVLPGDAASLRKYPRRLPHRPPKSSQHPIAKASWPECPNAAPEICIRLAIKVSRLVSFIAVSQ